MDNLKKAANQLRMTEAEKQAMRRRIFGVPVAAPPRVPRLHPRTFEGRFFLGRPLLHTRVLASAFVLVLVFGGVGTAAAAQGALPGDMLYPVKLSVNEAVEAALATTPEARAEVSTKQALRRVEEAEVLAARGELTPRVGEELAANFEAHADTAQKSAEAVSISDPAAAESLRAKLSSSLAAHGAILATLTEGGGPANQEGAEVVAAKIIARADTGRAAPPARAAKSAPAPEAEATMSLLVATDTGTSSAGQAATGTEATAAETDASATVPLEDEAESAAVPAPPGAEERAERLRDRTEQALADTRERFEEHKSEFLDTIVTKVSSELADIEDTMDQASTALKASDTFFAAQLYTQAFERATKLEVLLRVEARLKRNIITPILEQKLIMDQGLPANFPVL